MNDVMAERKPGLEIKPATLPEPRQLADRYLHLQSLEEFWQRVESMGRNPHLRADLDRVLNSEYQVTTMKRISELDDDTLHTQLAADFQASYGRLGDECPTTWVELISNLPQSGESYEPRGLAANPIDYFSQRLAIISGAEELLPLTPQNPDALKRIIQNERDRLARLLISIERSDNSDPLRQAA